MLLSKYTDAISFVEDASRQSDSNVSYSDDADNSHVTYDPNHVRLSDIALDQAPETANLLIQLPSPLFDIGSDFSNEYMNWEELWPTSSFSDAALNTVDVLQHNGYLDFDSPAQNHGIADLNLVETLSEDVQDLLPRRVNVRNGYNSFGNGFLIMLPDHILREQRRRS